jgi:hypothetical protein
MHSVWLGSKRGQTNRKVAHKKAVTRLLGSYNTINKNTKT